MAISTDDPTGNDSVATEANIDGDAEVPVQPDLAPAQNDEDEDEDEDEDTNAEDGNPAVGDIFSTDNSAYAESGNLVDPHVDPEVAESAAPIDADPIENNINIEPSEPEGSDERSVDDPADAEATEFTDAPEHKEHDRAEEIPVLLGTAEISDNEEARIVEGHDAVEEAAASEDGGNAEGTIYKADLAMDLLSQLDSRLIPTMPVEPGHAADGIELKLLQESLHDALVNTQYISSKVDAVSNDTGGLLQKVDNLSVLYESLTAEMDSISSGGNTKSILSKTFLTTSLAVLALLVVFQIYMFASLIKLQRLQNSTGSSVLENISILNKKMAEYDKNLTKALAASAQQEHVRQNLATAEKSAHEATANNEAGSANTTPVLEKLNKMRNGLPEKKLIRKETGDWFVFNKKSEECISDVDVIEALNQAYKKIGRSLAPSVPLPTHKALCILKPDGKGGTEVVMTKTFSP